MAEERESSPPTNQEFLDTAPDSSVVDLNIPLEKEANLDPTPALPEEIYQFGGSVDEPIEGEELTKLRTFLFEKLTTRELRQLLNTVGGPKGADSSPTKVVKTSVIPPIRPPRMKRRVPNDIPPFSVSGKRSFLLPADMRFSFSVLCISNFTIETPPTAAKDINCVKICSGTRRILYDTNFMLAEDWCSSVISVHFDNIKWISVFKEQLVINLVRPAIVEASYKNGAPALLGIPSSEIENAMHHTVMMRSPHELVGIKTAILSADPNMVHKFTACKMEPAEEDNGGMHSLHERYGRPGNYVPQQSHFRLSSNTSVPSHYMVPQVAPASYGNNICGQQSMYPRQGQDGLHFFGGPFFTAPQQMFQGSPLFSSQYSQPPQEMPPVSASNYCIQSLLTNAMQYVEPRFAQMDGDCVPPQEDRIQDLQVDVSPPEMGPLEMAMLGVDEIDACSDEERATAALSRQWGAGASHLGFFDAPTP